MEGLELRRNQVDLLLGPGMNIQQESAERKEFQIFARGSLSDWENGGSPAEGHGKSGHQRNDRSSISPGNNQEFSRESGEFGDFRKGAAERFI